MPSTTEDELRQALEAAGAPDAAVTVQSSMLNQFATLRSGAATGYRQAHLYVPWDQPDVWRTQFMNPSAPDHGYTTGWNGGRVAWGSDKTTRAEAIALGLDWILHERMPEGTR